MANMYVNAMTDLWNTAGTAYSAIKMNVTNAASMGSVGSPVNEMSKLLDLQIAGVNKFWVDKFGNAVSTGTISAVGGVISSGPSVPSANDAASLGVSGNAWSDLFLADGGVINWKENDVAITQSTNTLAFSGASTGYIFDAMIRPLLDNGPALGMPGAAWSDLFLGDGGIVSWHSGDVFIAHSANTLTFTGAASGYIFDATVKPSLNAIGALGASSYGFSSLFLASGAVIDFDNNNSRITHSSGILTVNTGDLRVTTAGTDNASVVTVAGTQTLTGKSLTSPVISGTGTISSGNLAVTGTILATDTITTNSQYFTSTAANVILSCVGGGAVILRPNGATNVTGQSYVNTAGNLQVSGDIHAAGGTISTTSNFHSTSGVCILSASGDGSIYFRPTGPASATDQWYIASDGGLRGHFIHLADRGGTAPVTHNIMAHGQQDTGAVLGYNDNSAYYGMIGFHQTAVRFWGGYFAGAIYASEGFITSDANTKENIEDCDCLRAHQQVMAIGIKNYRKIQHYGGEETGWLAQDVEEVLPHAVLDIPIPDFDTRMREVTGKESVKATNDHTMLGVLWAAVQHQAHMIDRLQDEVDELK